MKLIKVNKCIKDKTYYLTGMFYNYNFETFMGDGNHKPMINTSIKFLGVNKSVSNGGKHLFKTNDEEIYLCGDDDLFLEPISNPQILK